MMADDDPITLSEACTIIFGGAVKIATLRAEAARGNLLVFRVGRRDFTTLKAMREMVRKCQDAARLRASTSIENGNNGLSATDQVSSAQAALNQTVEALKRGLPHISARSTNRSDRNAH